MKAIVFAVSAAVVLAFAGTAHAYPQFQLYRDKTCSGCHISPAGGGLLNENGLNDAEEMSTFGTAPEFLNGIVKPPSWLTLGGDFRGSTGYFQTPQRYLLGIPMQADLYASAQYEHFTFHVTAVSAARVRERERDAPVVEGALRAMAVRRRLARGPVRARRPADAGVRAAVRRAR